MEQEIDWLRESAKAFAKLKNIRYDLIITHAGKLVSKVFGDTGRLCYYGWCAENRHICVLSEKWNIMLCYTLFVPRCT